MEYGGAPGMDPNVNPEFARPTKVMAQHCGGTLHTKRAEASLAGDWGERAGGWGQGPTGAAAARPRSPPPLTGGALAQPAV